MWVRETFIPKTELQFTNAILPCKTEFLSNKQNNDGNNEQTLNEEQNP